MSNSFSGIEIGKRSLNTHQLALNTVGHNLSNASVEGYSRQRVIMRSVDALYRPQLNREERAGQIGQGVEAASIERVRDKLLENRILAQIDDVGYWRTRDTYLLQVEQIHLEPYDNSVRALMDAFWQGWQELSVHPDGEAERQAVLRRGESLMDGVNRRYSRLKEVRNMIDEDLVVSVGEVNGILTDIKELNEEIVKSEAMDDNPNDLYDRRDLLVNKLADYLTITVDNRDPDEFLVHTGGFHLIQGAQVSYITTDPNPDNEGYHDIRWETDGELLIPRYGKFGSLLELRDIDIRDEIQSLDEMTMAFADLVNEIHREAWSAKGITDTIFFREYPFVDNVSGNYDRDGDGVLDSTYIYRLSGSNELNLRAVIGFAGTITIDGIEGPVDIPYTAVDTVEMVLDRINSSVSEISARLNWNGRLELRAGTAEEIDNPDFVIRHVEDSGQFLTGYAGLLGGSGPLAAYDWQVPDAALSLQPGETAFSISPLSHPSGWLRVNEELVVDPSKIVASLSETGYTPSGGDNRAALAIAQLRHHPVLEDQNGTFDDWFALAAANIGLKGEIAAQTKESQDLVIKELEDLRQSISGVNLDEEFSEMIKFQHGYNAAARFITTIDKMLETIINRLGV
ncbi:Flagellar hook-associated protein FlgK [Olavius algarvensis spirochete endosymbiont]|uniref:flagellar hook-associated protein FlgK n=1 Tax=Olavius algarvensis spirochete endosymbiont TaxID=260710 RepID=UPI000F172016|nr:flagellar hook-associated protein FlgK [Olavius algarvensis spirochete endosymbiont]CAD7838832.1 MAG: Flagellar hook-associated protein FlgK [Olavius algarvensis spirochete endosymbiont]VDB01267.1 Flagellar hook-associated protein FlgK [Olavius algarvensis spirochete endosymbiont]